jgi:hypothetical protein
MDSKSKKLDRVIQDSYAFFKGLELDSLIWFPHEEMGFYPVLKSDIYDVNYFKKYQTYSDTPMGRELVAKRIAFVKKFYSGPLVDVGIGCGDFVARRPEPTYGFDVNPVGVAWLEDHKKYLNPREDGIGAASFWDSLEHVIDPENIMKNIVEWVFCSLPIFDNLEHILKSKHFKTDEHCWYWTRRGFIEWMRKYMGFEFIGQDSFEKELGREDIYTFAFKRNR